MRELKNFSFFTEVNTFKIHAQTILNRLRNQNKITSLVPAIQLILEGKSDNSISWADINTLNSLLHHPERFIKNIDPKVKETIYFEMKDMLQNFLTEINNQELSYVNLKCN
ncbi:hypothetical protein OQJ18_01190 [Fluoribacter dumoffii]|uniref:Uncharacterized protein n=1 Tax=Fluoribacter dumoffii TaxID=463 RepID=A0A377GBN1_9GAMM|nr:hypothetical protein [Fluoribacter dumoffii]KTC90536.1 hypothetical protein Ldum_1604 [Fluoribacter dumoffii NY 23]MCW8386216.1 hypothetical protein [Fluoribacter dumoffii]MCW8419267.1 hypothetical protein [Fluoribacter dumoffii]MCW8452858.1 hypothetical protein [Fluoribacter dumoffii]MCW8459892.1 hypothetical protein [Fluoribacter dumoffii]